MTCARLLNERKAYFSLRLILAAVRKLHRAEIAPWIGFRALTATALHGRRLRTTFMK